MFCETQLGEATCLAFEKNNDDDFAAFYKLPPARLKKGWKSPEDNKICVFSKYFEFLNASSLAELHFILYQLVKGERWTSEGFRSYDLMENVYSLIFFTERNIQKICNRTSNSRGKGGGGGWYAQFGIIPKIRRIWYAYCIIFPCGSHQ